MLDTPNCCSLGRLVEDEGYKFTWEQGKCYLWNPHGAWTQLAVRNYVPFLELAAEERPGSDDEYAYVVGAFIATMGQDHPELPHVLDGVAAMWPSYLDAACAAREGRAGLMQLFEKGTQMGATTARTCCSTPKAKETPELVAHKLR